MGAGRREKSRKPARTSVARRLPPLNALKAFEASARLGSFVLAAAELNVTPGAVAQQIKKLEDFYGRQLFIRRNNRLLATDVARAVHAVSADMMDELAKLTQRLIDGAVRSSLILSVLPSVGVRWLNRRLPAFLAANPDVRIDLRLQEDPVDFSRDRIDVRLSYGEHLYPELVTDSVTPMCRPELLQSGRVDPTDPDSLRDEDLIHVVWRAGFSSYPDWDTWLAHENGGRRNGRSTRRELGHTTDASSLAIDLARAGCGVVLGQSMFAESELAAGDLVAPFARRLPLPYAYCAVHPAAGERNLAVRAFVDWLRNAAA
jgi:LysR family glycine cleavage system transcriptional activator